MNTLFENIINYFKSYYLEILNLIITIIILIIMIIFINKNTILKSVDNQTLNMKQEESINNTFINVDIKGAVKKPGVYSVKDNFIINDVIKIAGGLKKSASTENINLSKQVKNEMVIYISTKNQLKKRKSDFYNNNINQNDISKLESSIEINNEDAIETGVKNISSLQSNQKESIINNSKLININTCTKEDLLMLNGIGESKADKIIDYRNINGLFKTIDDIKNVSGIGETAFEKIKDYITV